MICEDLSMRPIGPQNARTIPCAQGIFRQIIAIALKLLLRTPRCHDFAH